MFHFISTPLIQVPHNPNWILARCCGEYCRVLTMRGHKKPTQAGSNDAEDELMVAISLQISPRATADSSAARTASASQHGGGATDTRWQHGQHIYISFIQCQNIYYLYYLLSILSIFSVSGLHWRHGRVQLHCGLLPWRQVQLSPGASLCVITAGARAHCDVVTWHVLRHPLRCNTGIVT